MRMPTSEICHRSLLLIAANGIGAVSEPKALGLNCCARASLLYDICDERFRTIFNFVLNFAPWLP
jgi:hypothetical protein